MSIRAGARADGNSGPAPQRAARLQPRLVALVVWGVLLAMGCAHEVTITPAAPVPAVSSNPLPVPLVVQRIDVLSPAGAESASPAFEDRVLLELRRSNGFESVAPARPADGLHRDAVQLVVLLKQRVDEHRAANVARTAVALLSLFTLAPWLPLHTEYQAELHAFAVTCDGWGQRLVSSAKGELRSGPGADETRARTELIERVVEQALAELADRIAGDEPLRTRVASLVREGDCKRRVLDDAGEA
jgi:hypothetical protein